MKQRAAIFSNWRATVDGQEVETAAPVFYTNRGHVRGLTDARMMGPSMSRLVDGSMTTRTTHDYHAKSK